MTTHPSQPFDWRSAVVDPAPLAPEGFRSLVTPTSRGSTTLFERAADLRDDWDAEKSPYTYGLHGTPTVLELGARIARIEQGRHCFITPGGQAAIALIYLAFCGAGDHALLPETAYGPNQGLAGGLMQRLGVEVETYDPMIGAGIAALIRPHTRLVWCESPGSATMEIQDVPAIAAAAHRAGAVVALDNTYAAGVLFDAFAHGVDVTMQALTKYIGGHSDLLLGSVTCRDEAHYRALGEARNFLGMAASPDDCSLALRGLQTLAVRLDQLERSTLEVAQWLAARPEVQTVLHPALPSCPGHEIWRRDFTGSASVFSIVLGPQPGRAQIEAFVDRLRLFKIGYSWGGVTSLVAPYFKLRRTVRPYGDRLVRLNVGLEPAPLLIADLEQALSALA